MMEPMRMGWVFNSITREWNEPNEESIGGDLPDDTWIFGEASAVDRCGPPPARICKTHRKRPSIHD